MKKLRHEKELVQEAIKVGGAYMEKRGAGEFEHDDHADLKVRAIYALLVHDNLIQPLPRDEESVQMMRHKLAIWIAKHLPEDHPLKQ